MVNTSTRPSKRGTPLTAENSRKFRGTTTITGATHASENIQGSFKKRYWKPLQRSGRF